MDSLLGKQITLGRASLDHYLREILVEENRTLLHLCRIKCHLDNFSLAIGVGSEIHHPRARSALRQVVFAVAGYTGDIESLDEVEALLSVTIHHIVYGALVVLLEHTDVEDILANEYLVGHLDNLILTILIEDDDIVDIGAIAYIFVLLERSADESLLTVDIEFLVGLNDGSCLDGVEVAYLGATGMLMSILVAQELKPIRCHLHHVCQVAVNLLYLSLDAGREFVGLVLIKLQYALHLDFKEFEDVVLGHLAHKLGVIGSESLVDMLAHCIHVGSLFKLAVFINAFLDKYLFERSKMILFEQFGLAYLEFLTQQVLGVIH